MVDFPVVIATANAAKSALGELINIRDWAKNAQSELAVVNAQRALVETIAALNELRHENSDLKEKQSKNRKLNIKIRKLEKINQVFYDKSDDCFRCTLCLEKEEKIFTLYEEADNSEHLSCKNCNNKFRNPRFNREKFDQELNKIQAERRLRFSHIGAQVNNWMGR